MTPGETTPDRATRRVVLATLALGAILACVFSLAGSGDPVGAVASLVVTLGPSSATPLLWFLASLGMGLALHRSLPLAFCLGVGVHLSIWHALGALGFASSMAVAWAPVALGLGLLVWKRRELAIALRGVSIGWPVALSSVALGLLAVACALPPGTIWASEANAYDSLSYHLQLPREWHANGVIAPLTHNVYSHLPSYTEAAFTQLFAMHPGDPTAGAMTPLFASRVLHALLALAAAGVAGAFVASRSNERAGAWAVPFVLSVPWVVVTGSLAYSELAVALMGAGALVALFEEERSPVARGATIGFLMGVAVGTKATAMFTLALPIGVAMLIAVRPKKWPSLFGATGAAGAITIAPWLIRNWAHTGNPVFPYLTDLFGLAHWTPEQAERWAGAHTEGTSLVGRLGLFAGERGFGHEQWGIFAPLVAFAVVACIANKQTRRVGIILGAVLLAQVIAWLSIGHLQSRFLLPTVVPGACAVALASRALQSRVVPLLLALLTLTLAGLSSGIYLSQTQGNPAWALLPGVRVFTEALDETTSEMRPEAFVRTMLPAGSRVLLIGDATALYFPDSVAYHTTWDASPFGDALDASDGDARAASRVLLDAGFTHALINFDELARLIGDGWYDPRVTLERAARLAEAGTTIGTWATGERPGTRLVVLSDGSPPAR